MKDYKKPLFVMTDGVSEGVYMASGDSATCWTTTISSPQSWNGSHHVFEVRAVHSNSVQHIYDAVTIEITFSNIVTHAYSENDWTCTVAGNKVTVTRQNHGNGYNSGDTVTFKVWAKCGDDQAMTEALAATNIRPVQCHYRINVQGGGANLT